MISFSLQFLSKSPSVARVLFWFCWCDTVKEGISAGEKINSEDLRMRIFNSHSAHGWHNPPQIRTLSLAVFLKQLKIPKPVWDLSPLHWEDC